MELGEGATCFSCEGEFGRGDLGGVLMYEFVMVALQEVCLSSSCHQTSVFHLSTHFFTVSLNLLRSSNQQGCARRVHCIMCAMFSVARPHSQVVSPS